MRLKFKQLDFWLDKNTFLDAERVLIMDKVY